MEISSDKWKVTGGVRCYPMVRLVTLLSAEIVSYCCCPMMARVHVGELAFSLARRTRRVPYSVLLSLSIAHLADVLLNSRAFYDSMSCGHAVHTWCRTPRVIPKLGDSDLYHGHICSSALRFVTCRSHSQDFQEDSFIHKNPVLCSWSLLVPVIRN